MSKQSVVPAVFALVLFAPQLALAQTISQMIGLFNILVGLMLVSAFLAMCGGFIVYLVRMGNNNRDEGLNYMMWGVTILFVLIILLAVVQLVQHLLSR